MAGVEPLPLSTPIHPFSIGVDIPYTPTDPTTEVGSVVGVKGAAGCCRETSEMRPSPYPAIGCMPKRRIVKQSYVINTRRDFPWHMKFESRMVGTDEPFPTIQIELLGLGYSHAASASSSMFTHNQNSESHNSCFSLGWSCERYSQVNVTPRIAPKITDFHSKPSSPNRGATNLSAR